MEQQKIMNGRYIVGVEVAKGNSKETLNVWRIEGDKKELRFSEDLYKLRSNFYPYCNSVGMPFEHFVQLAVQYAELAVMMLDCDYLVYDKDLGDDEKPHIKEYLSYVGCFCIDSRISDEEKFMCALISCDAKDYGLITRTLNELYGWTRYKARKIAASVKGKLLVTLISEEQGGYYGKGWALESAVRTFCHIYRAAVLERRKNGLQDFFERAPDKV